MSSTFEEQYEDVLQNIEFALLSISQEYQELTDHNILRVVEAAIAYYKSQAANASLLLPHLSTHEHTMLERVKHICDWRLGKAESQLTPEIKSIEEMLLCLKRIQKSIKFWTKRGGRRGYINFATPFALVAKKKS